MTMKPSTDLSPEEKAKRAKLEQDVGNILTFGTSFLAITVVIWAAYCMAAPFWNLPGASYWTVLGTSILLYVARKLVDSFRK